MRTNRQVRKNRVWRVNQSKFCCFLSARDPLLKSQCNALNRSATDPLLHHILTQDLKQPIEFVTIAIYTL